MTSITNSRLIAYLALKDIYQKQAYTDIALQRGITTVSQQQEVSQQARSFACELVYGTLRRQRTLDSLIDLLGKKKAAQQPPNLRIILHLGLYQLRYLDNIPSSAAVNTSVEIAKVNGLGRLAGVVNGLLRAYLRQAATADPLQLPNTETSRLGVLHSFPDWMVEIFLEQLSPVEVDRLLSWFNQAATIDLRVNVLKTTREEVIQAFLAQGITVSSIPGLPQGLRISGAGAIANLPGYQEGWWVIQDSSAQLVSHLLDPQPGETIIDACAAPGGKTTHIAELMGDRGKIIAGDRSAKRLQKVIINAQRLDLSSIEIATVDSRNLTEFTNTADRVLLDAPCSGLGTLHKRPDIRWRKTFDSIQELLPLQRELLERTATWVKPQGTLVYATCTLNLWENEKIVKSFLDNHPHWSIQSPPDVIPKNLITEQGWIKVFPHLHNMDGFFMVRLIRN